MLRSRFLNASLLGFLVLFLNFGPALHRAPFFHYHSGGEKDASSACCHCCVHPDALSSLQGRNGEPFISEQSLGSDGPCSICEFFKKYQSTELLHAIELNSDRVSFIEPLCQSILKTAAIVSTARGPPIF
jgi:hypothetical protein